MTSIEWPESLLALDVDMVRWRLLLAFAADGAAHATLVGDPAPITKAFSDRMRNPVPGDLVYEVSALAANRTGPRWDHEPWWPQHAVGILQRVVNEPMYTEEEWRASGDTRPVPMEDVWYVKYGPDDEDVVRWTNCTFRAIVVDWDNVERVLALARAIDTDVLDSRR